MKKISSDNKKHILKLVYAALCLALCILLPFLTANIPTFGQMLSPMHIPAFLAGFLCGPFFGAAVGFAGPLLRSLTVGMPPFFPGAFSMAFELAAYALTAGLLNRVFPKKPLYLYISLTVSMLAGRAVWGAVRFIIFGFGGTAFSFEVFLADAFASALPGIAVHLILVPAIVLALRKARYDPNV